MASNTEDLYSLQPGHVRSNANLPGTFVYPVTRLTGHAICMDQFRTAIEKAEAGDWDSWNIAEGANPVGEMMVPYGQYSRAEGMKGSEQTVRINPAAQQQLQGMGNPNLTPSPGLGGPVVVIQNGMRELKEKKGLKGLGGWR